MNSKFAGIKIDRCTGHNCASVGEIDWFINRIQSAVQTTSKVIELATFSKPVPLFNHIEKGDV